MTRICLLALIVATGCRKATLEVEDMDGDGFAATEDCNDEDDAVFPGAEETCDGIDNDCSGIVDDGAIDAAEWFADDDADGVGIVRGSVFACDAPEGFVNASGDCNDANDRIYPGAPELCDGLDNDCNGLVEDDGTAPWYPDSDGDGVGAVGIALDACEPPDGYVATTGDCDDRNDTVGPDQVEVCDALDNNCDGTVDEGLTQTFYADGDGDGFGGTVTTQACELPPGFTTEPGDCNDASALALPGGTEVCDQLDNNCDGTVDEGLTSLFYADADGDGFGSTVTTRACELPQGFTTEPGDCNDASALALPGGTEVCDALDNNCDGTVDEGLTSLFYADGDADGFGSDVTTRACELPQGFSTRTGDCNDSQAAAFPGNTEVCDFVDNDCDGTVDEELRTTYYADADGDGAGTSGLTLSACNQPANWSTTQDDCNDGNASVFPGAEEVCDGVDNNCDSAVDEGLDREWFIDADRDGYGTEGSAIVACEAPSDRYTDVSGDCNDLDASYNPDAAPACDDTDRNCDGLVDNDADEDGLADAACGGSDCDDADPTLPNDAGFCALGTTCLDVRERNPFATSGAYSLDLDGTGPMDPVDVSCDFDSDGGGWTLVFLVDDLGGSGRVYNETGGFQRRDFFDLFDHTRFTDATWTYDATTETVSAGTEGLVWGTDQGALDIGLFADQWTDVRMTCSQQDNATQWEQFVAVDGYTTANGNHRLLGAASNGVSYTVASDSNSFGLSTVWHDNELTTVNSGHFLCDVTNSGNGTTQFGFCYTDFLRNPNSSDYGDSIVSIAFGSSGLSGDGWSNGFTAECGRMGQTAQQNNGTYAIWIR